MDDLKEKARLYKKHDYSEAQLQKLKERLKAEAYEKFEEEFESIRKDFLQVKRIRRYFVLNENFSPID